MKLQFRWQSILFWAVVLALLLYRPVVIHGIPFSAFTFARHDDGLFFRLALELRNGNWLGDYTTTTLCKGPFYPMFVAFVRTLSAPLPVVEQSFFAAVALIAVWSVRPAISNRLLLVFGLALLIFNPFNWGQLPPRFARTPMSGQLALLCMAATVGLILRCSRPKLDLVVWGALAGVAGAACWMTREEGIWVIAPAALLLGIGAATLLRQGKIKLARAAVMAGVPVIFGILPVLSVCEQNRTHYGTFAVVDIKCTEFQDAYGALLRVGLKHYRHYVPVPVAARTAMYRISPTLRQIEPLMEGSLGMGWIHHQPVMDDPQDLQGGWFIWAFRAAAQGVSETKNGPPLEFYRRVADEVNAACEAGLLEGGSKRSTLATPLNREDFPVLWRNLVRCAKDMVFWPPRSGGVVNARNDADQEGAAADLAGTPLTGPQHRGGFISGWACAAAGQVTLATQVRGGPIVPFKPQWNGSPDVSELLRSSGKQWPNARNCRFSGVVDRRATHLLILLGGQQIARLPLVPQSPRFSDEHASIQVDNFVTHPLVVIPRWKLDIDRMASTVFVYVAPALSLVTLAWFVFGLSTIRANLLWICITGNVAIATCLRFSLFAYVDATTYPAWSQGYNGPSYSMLAFLHFLAICALSLHFSRRKSVRQQKCPQSTQEAAVTAQPVPAGTPASHRFMIWKRA